MKKFAMKLLSATVAIVLAAACSLVAVADDSRMGRPGNDFSNAAHNSEDHAQDLEQNDQEPDDAQEHGRQDPGSGQTGSSGQQTGPRVKGLLERLADDLDVDCSESETSDTLAARLKAAIEALDSDDLATLAKKYNIDTSDMTASEIVAAVEALLEKPADNGQSQNGKNGRQGKGLLEAMAKDLGVTVSESESIDTLTAALKTAIEALDSDELEKFAEQYGIDTDGKTDSEILAAAEALLEKPADNGQNQNGKNGRQGRGLLEAMAKDLGVTVTENESLDTLTAALKTAIEALDSDDLEEFAEKYGIDTDGKTDSEILAAAEALLEKPADNGQKPNGSGLEESGSHDAVQHQNSGLSGAVSNFFTKLLSTLRSFFSGVSS